MTPDRKMAALFAAEAPPARDFAFEAVLAQRVAARRLWTRIAAMVPLTVAAAAGLWGLQPLWPSVAPALGQTLGQAQAAMPDLLPALVLTGAAGATAALLVRASRRLRRV